MKIFHFFQPFARRGAERLRPVWLAVVATALTALSTALSITVASDRNPEADLDAAIASAGGAQALANARVLTWRGNATVHAGGRTIELEGDWAVEPPDRANVSTWERSKGRESARSLRIDGDHGETSRNGNADAPGDAKP
jgi:hypothetical protein